MWGGGGSCVEDVRGVRMWGATSIHMYSAYTNSTCTYLSTYVCMYVRMVEIGWVVG